MRVKSHTTGGARRWRENTPELKFDRSYSMSHRNGQVVEYVAIVHAGERTHHVIFQPEDISRMIANICSRSDGYEWLRRELACHGPGDAP